MPPNFQAQRCPSGSDFPKAETKIVILRNERILSDHEYKSAQEFISKMDLGFYDGHPGLSTELSKLSSEQLEDIAKILIQRSSLGEKTK